MEHLAELLLKVIILCVEGYNLYKLEKTLKALVESRKLEQRPQTQPNLTNENDLPDKVNHSL